MKLRHLILLTLIAALALTGCATTTAPDGTVTKAPDAPTIGVIGSLITWAYDTWGTAPAALPPITPAK